MLRLVIRPCVVLIVVVLCVLAGVLPVSAQGVSVTSAEPATGEQDTLSLDVRVKGKNFAPGAEPEFLLDDDTNGGISVNGTTFVNSTELVANIRISPGATLTLFDIRVRNQNGRTGRGSDLFQVVEKGARGGACTPGGVPAGFVEVAALNDGSRPVQNMAIDMKVVPTTVNGVNVLMAAASSGSGVEVYFLSATGTNGIKVDVVSPHQSLKLTTSNSLVQSVAVGDVNQDGTPDVVAADHSVAALFLGRRGTADAVEFEAGLPLVAGNYPNVNYGRGLAIGDLYPLQHGLEIALTQTGMKGGKTGTFLPVVHLFSYTSGGVTKLQSIRPTVSPALTYDEGFGHTIAIADVDGTGDLDLIAASRKKGQLWVFPGPSLDADADINGYQPVALPSPTFRVGAGDVDGIPGAEVIATSGWAEGNTHGEIFRNLIIDTDYTLRPESEGLGRGWGTKEVAVGLFNADAYPDVAVGAPNAEPSSACTNMGAAYVFLGQSEGGWERLRFNPPTYNGTFNAYGWSVQFGSLDGRRLLFVGEQGADVAGVNNAGQVYVYRKENP